MLRLMCLLLALLQAYSQLDQISLQYLGHGARFLHGSDLAGSRTSHLRYASPFLYSTVDVYAMQKIRQTESDRLRVQVNAYLDNKIEVQTLLADSEIKAAALEQVAQLEDSLAQVHQPASYTLLVSE